jgi:hypothetical protein
MQLGRLGKQHGFSRKILSSMAVDVSVPKIMVSIRAIAATLLHGLIAACA